MTKTHEGHLDIVDTENICGWARSPIMPERPVSVELYVNEKLLATVKADRFRQDLRDKKRGDGYAGFLFRLNKESLRKVLKCGPEIRISARYAGFDGELAGSPKTFIISNQIDPKDGISATRRKARCIATNDLAFRSSSRQSDLSRNHRQTVGGVAILPFSTIATFPYLYIVYGEPGTGKSSFAYFLSKHIGASTISGDHIAIEVLGYDGRKIQSSFDNAMAEQKSTLLSRLCDDIKKSLASGNSALVLEGYIFNSFVDELVMLFEHQAIVCPVNKNRINALSCNGVRFRYRRILLAARALRKNKHDNLKLKRAYNPRMITLALGRIHHGALMAEVDKSAYQAFSDIAGSRRQTSSNTETKYKTVVSAPGSLAGKRCLDIGCNFGRISFLMATKGRARSVLGLETMKTSVTSANKINQLHYKLPHVRFKQGDYMSHDFGAERFDFIGMFSVFHYMREHQQFALGKVRSLLSPGGTFVLETGLSQENKASSTHVEKYKRGVDTVPCHFPNERTLGVWLYEAGFSIPNIHASVNQTGDRIPRYVITLSTR